MVFKKILLLLGLLLAAMTVTAFVPTFTSEQAAIDWKTNVYKSPSFGTATIKEITTTLESDFYQVSYTLSYIDEMTREQVSTEVNMEIRKPLPEDSAVIDDLINSHALDYFDSQLAKTPDPKINLITHNFIGRTINLIRYSYCWDGSKVADEKDCPEPPKEDEIINLIK